MKKMKKMLALLLFAVIGLSILSVTAFAARYVYIMT